jgi:hypothetical protein
MPDGGKDEIDLCSTVSVVTSVESWKVGCELRNKAVIFETVWWSAYSIGITVTWLLWRVVGPVVLELMVKVLIPNSTDKWWDRVNQVLISLFLGSTMGGVMDSYLTLEKLMAMRSSKKRIWNKKSREWTDWSISVPTGSDWFQWKKWPVLTLLPLVL